MVKIHNRWKRVISHQLTIYFVRFLFSQVESVCCFCCFPMKWIKNASVCIFFYSCPYLLLLCLWSLLFDSSRDLLFSSEALFFFFFSLEILRFSDALLFYFSLPLNISRSRNANMKPWTPGTIGQRAELLSAFIAEGNVSALLCIAIKFLHLLCFWGNRM